MTITRTSLHASFHAGLESLSHDHQLQSDGRVKRSQCFTLHLSACRWFIRASVLWTQTIGSIAYSSAESGKLRSEVATGAQAKGTARRACMLGPQSTQRQSAASRPSGDTNKHPCRDEIIYFAFLMQTSDVASPWQGQEGRVKRAQQRKGRLNKVDDLR